MCCFFTSLFLLGPRVAGIIWWAIQPERWDLAFSSWLWPMFGIVFVPWTTMSYVLVKPAGINGFDWVWIALGIFADVAFWTGGAWGNRDRIPGSSSEA
jgi:hypothetical protein